MASGAAPSPSCMRNYPPLLNCLLIFTISWSAGLLGVWWGLWHAPVIEFLGAASPHGRALPAFFVAFVGTMAAMRVRIAWFYEQTQSGALAQLIHSSCTGGRVVFSPPGVNPAQE